MIDADMDFHFAIYSASGNRLIGETARVHWVHLRRVMGAVLQVSGQRAHIWDEHLAIAVAIEAGDMARAMRLSEAHTRRAHQHLVEQIGAVISAHDTAIDLTSSVDRVSA